MSQTPSGPNPNFFDSHAIWVITPEDEPEIMLDKFNGHLLSVWFVTRLERDAKNIMLPKVIFEVAVVQQKGQTTSIQLGKW